jgi:Arc/MetJ-type ribon-helix-helix transcriptional regulator
VKVTLTPEAARFVNELIDRGEFHDAAEVVEQVLRERDERPAASSESSAIPVEVLEHSPERSTTPKLGSWHAFVAELYDRNQAWLKRYDHKFGVFSGTN